MSVTLFNYFQAREGKSHALRSVLASAIPTIKASPGRISCQLLQSHDNPPRFVVVEVWDRFESHQAAVEAIPDEALAGVMELLDGMPTGEYFLVSEPTA